jgi:hypothetical protein
MVVAYFCFGIRCCGFHYILAVRRVLIILPIIIVRLRFAFAGYEVYIV